MKRKNRSYYMVGLAVLLGLLIMPPALCILMWYAGLSVSAGSDTLIRLTIIVALIGATLVGLGVWIANIISLVQE